MKSRVENFISIRLVPYILVLVRLAFCKEQLKVGLGLQIHIENKEHAKYVENHAPSYLWKVNSSCEYGYCLWRFCRQTSVSICSFHLAYYNLCRHLLPKMRGTGIIFKET